MHVWLVDLHDIRARLEQIADFLVDGDGIVHGGEFPAAAIVFDLGLLSHGEGAGHRNLDLAGRMAPQEQNILDLHGVPPPDVADDSWNRIRMPAAVERAAGIVDIHSVERGCKSIRVTFAAHLAVGDDVDAGVFLRLDRHDRGVVLRLLKIFRRDAPQLPGTYARRKAARQLGAVDEPLGLWVAADDGGGKQFHDCRGACDEAAGDAGHVFALEAAHARVQDSVGMRASLPEPVTQLAP